MQTTHYIVLTGIFIEEDDGRWTATCKELGTATFGHSLKEAQENIAEMIELHLNTLEEVGERKRFFKENGIVIKTKHPPKSIQINTPFDPRIFVHPMVQPIQYADAY